MEVRTAISLMQPWASAMALGLKRVETRSWSTAMRGPIAIHASKGFPVWAKEFALTEAYAYIKHEPEWFPRGCIVAVGILIDVVPTARIRNQLFDRELFFGDYSDGRFAWIFDRIRPLAEPIPETGRLGLWTPSQETIAALREQTGRVVA